MKIKFTVIADVVDATEGDANLSQCELEELAMEMETGIVKSFEKVPFTTEDYNCITLVSVEVDPFK